ncbi:hypothetical protein IBKLEAMG_00169 [Klebsiella phage vB_KppS-Storm]|uniref:Uncharacterized protein n=1 Tax=Klebsiella phage vB_KppS-Storm TaxID=2762828 RepID=A0A7R8MM51_9CAUD|nr:hypothetical protein IBKLEAMG_00169 [Klebsiella phage vB_KppS-Storm]
MKLAIVGFGLAMLSGAALAEVSAPAIVTPEKVRPIECRVSVTFAKEGTVTAVLRNQDFDSVTVDSGTWGFMVEPEPEKLEVKTSVIVSSLTMDELADIVSTYDEIHADAIKELNNRLDTFRDKL